MNLFTPEEFQKEIIRLERENLGLRKNFENTQYYKKEITRLEEENLQLKNQIVNLTNKFKFQAYMLEHLMKMYTDYFSREMT